ncbi:MAG: hypothetical protein DRO14_01110 [Thermoprotei archaeon]|nr:MAG: hypothetical protein DRO14_01110 [Thermoprotei archaeon]
MTGHARTLLSLERVVMNFLRRLRRNPWITGSGICSAEE